LEAESSGKQGKAEALVTHAKKSLDSAKRAQRSGHNERLNEGVYALGEAIEHGEKQQTTDATEHMMHAILKLSQSAGLQIPGGVAVGKTSAKRPPIERLNVGECILFINDKQIGGSHEEGE